MMKLTSYSPDEAYKRMVKPLGLFFMAGAIMQAFIMLSLPTEFWVDMPVPFFHTTISKIALMYFLNIILAIIGIGLLRKWKTSWYLLFAYFIIGTLWLVAGIALNQLPNQEDKLLVIPVAIIMNSGIALAIYFGGKPVFSESSRN